MIVYISIEMSKTLWSHSMETGKKRDKCEREMMKGRLLRASSKSGKGKYVILLIRFCILTFPHIRQKSVVITENLSHSIWLMMKKGTLWWWWECSWGNLWFALNLFKFFLPLPLKSIDLISFRGKWSEEIFWEFIWGEIEKFLMVKNECLTVWNIFWGIREFNLWIGEIQ